ncbi:hypothetical protein CI644P1_00004 [Clostridium phage CI644P1]|nr:hypothetical protein CI644P1_00004 [Clostridium phage CI644P1]
MKNNDKHRKMLSVSKKLLNENDLDFTWYINRCNGVTGYLHNGKVPKLIVAVHLTEEVIKMCSPRMIANDLQYEYGRELLKEFKINMEVE